MAAVPEHPDDIRRRYGPQHQAGAAAMASLQAGLGAEGLAGQLFEPAPRLRQLLFPEPGPPTARLHQLLEELWPLTLSRLLLRASAAGIRALCQECGLRSPAEPLPRRVWTVPQLRKLYGPALARAARQLLAAGADPEGLLSSGHTPLGMCACLGWSEVAQALIGAKADPEGPDRQGIRPIQYAALFQEARTARLLAAAGARPADSGLGQQVSEPLLLELVSPVDRTWFERQALRLNRPAVLRGAAAELAGRCGREQLVAMAGGTSVELSPVPYAREFGASDPAVASTLAEYLADPGRKAPSGAAYYLFTMVSLELQPDLAGLLETELGGMPHQLPSPFDRCQASAIQFAAGVDGTGAPWHWHRDAMNLVIEGCKHWKLRPPSEAAVANGALSEEEEEAAFGDVRSVEVAQGPGDIVYVPFRWGHTVRNEGELTLAVAVEFMMPPDDGEGGA